MAGVTDTIRADIDKLAKVQQVDRELAAQAVNHLNAQQDLIRNLWAAVKASQALVGFAQAHLCLGGEGDVARDIAEEWAAVVDKVYFAVVPPRDLKPDFSFGSTLECPLLGVEQTSISGDWMSACS